MPSLALINGRPDNHCSILDRGLAYGHGLFETLAIHRGRPVWLERHLCRLAEGCRRLGIPFEDALKTQLVDELQSLCLQWTGNRAVAKIILTRGVGGRGYRVNGPMPPTRIVILAPWPDYPAHYGQQGIELTLCETRLGINPALAGVKHLNRLEQVLARGEWGDEYPEGLVRDCEDRVVEGTMSNLLLVHDDQLLTPALHRCGVAGIVRGVILDRARAEGVPVQEKDLSLEAVLQAEALLVCNSVIGVWPVRRFLNRDFGPSPWHGRIRDWVSEGESVSC